MAKVREDSDGKYIISEGKVIRPIDESEYETDSDVVVSPCKDTPIYGVGKNGTCKRGEYCEAWYDTGLNSDMHKTLIESENPDESLTEVTDIQKQLLQDYPITKNQDGNISFAEIRKEHKELLQRGDGVVFNALKESLSDSANNEIGSIPPLDIFNEQDDKRNDHD